MKHIIKVRLLCKLVIGVTCFIVTDFTVYSQDEKQLVIGHQRVYKVSRAKQLITVDGRMDEAAWKNVLRQECL